VTISEMRRQSYRLARDVGNVQAASHGPASYSKRVLRRNVYRTVNKRLGRGLRGLEL
jgi:hypothetical protein